MDASADLLGGLPDLLAFLTTGPHPDQVATRLVTGPGRNFDAAIAGILVTDGDNLRVIGRHAYLHADANARYPLWADLPVSHAVREGTVIVLDSARVEDEYADLAEAWNHAPELAGREAIVCGPIISRGMPIGGYFMACDSPPSWQTLDYALLAGCGRALALWLEHVGAPSIDDPTPDRGTPTLTQRQQAIVRHLAAGRTVTAIAATLGCSVSTVKSDLRSISRALDAEGRAGVVRRARELGLTDEPATP